MKIDDIRARIANVLRREHVIGWPIDPEVDSPADDARLFAEDGFLRREAQLAGKVLRYALDGHRTDGSPVFDVLQDALQKYPAGVKAAP